MEEWYNNFLSWLDNIMNPPTRIAPRAEDRYANSYRAYPDDPVFDPAIPGIKHSVITDPRSWWRPGWIMQNIDNGDTTYTENPQQKMGFNRTIRRSASSKDKNKKEYNILKRRFNTAWKIAKEQKQ